MPMHHCTTGGSCQQSGVINWNLCPKCLPFPLPPWTGLL